MKRMDAPSLIPEIPWRIHRYDTVDSTQNLALHEARNIVSTNPDLPPCSHFSVHIAQRQTQGRGQYARAWESPAGGLYLSLVIAGAPELESHATPLLAGVAVIRTILRLPGIRAAEGDITIRWPNDILLGGKKLAGILSEGISQGRQKAVVIGIGLNLNTKTADFPPRIATFATSLAAFTRRIYDTSDVVRLLLDQIQTIWRGLAAVPRSATLDDAIKQISLHDYLQGRLVSICADGQTITGRGDGLSAEGALLLQTAGRLIPILSGTIVAVDGEPVRAAL